MSEHYVSNTDFLQALIDYKKMVRRAKRNQEERPILPDYIGECYMKIADRLSRKSKFYSYTFRDDMISDGIENCLLYVDNFDPKKSSFPFAYFTQIIFYAFVRRIQREKKHLYVKYKITEEMLHNHNSAEFEDDQLPASSNSLRAKLYENISEYIDTYEKKIVEKKQKKRGVELFMREDQ